MAEMEGERERLQGRGVAESGGARARGGGGVTVPLQSACTLLRRRATQNVSEVGRDRMTICVARVIHTCM